MGESSLTPVQHPSIVTPELTLNLLEQDGVKRYQELKIPVERFHRFIPPKEFIAIKTCLGNALPSYPQPTAETIREIMTDIAVDYEFIAGYCKKTGIKLNLELLTEAIGEGLGLRSLWDDSAQEKKVWDFVKELKQKKIKFADIRGDYGAGSQVLSELFDKFSIPDKERIPYILAFSTGARCNTAPSVINLQYYNLLDWLTDVIPSEDNDINGLGSLIKFGSGERPGLSQKVNKAVDIIEQLRTLYFSKDRGTRLSSQSLFSL